jgi:hypothetical protein
MGASRQRGRAQQAREEEFRQRHRLAQLIDAHTHFTPEQLCLPPPDLVEQETGYARACERSLDRLRAGANLGTGGHIGWSRDSMHER